MELLGNSTKGTTSMSHQLSTLSKNVFITGASGALGSVVTEQLLSRGYQVAAHCHSQAGVEELLQRLGSQVTKHNMLAFHHDALHTQQGVETVLKHAESFFSGSPLSLIHTVGRFSYHQCEDSLESEFDDLIHSNFKSSWLLARALIPHMKKQNFGRMVFVSSRSTLGVGEAGMGLYLASKSALNMWIQCLAKEVLGKSITINAVLPTIIDTPANRQGMKDADYSQWVNPKDLSAFIISLLAKESDCIHGALLPVGKL